MFEVKPDILKQVFEHFADEQFLISESNDWSFSFGIGSTQFFGDLDMGKDLGSAFSLQLNKDFFEDKINTATYYFDKILPRVQGHYIAAISGSQSIMKTKFN